LYDVKIIAPGSPGFQTQSVYTTNIEICDINIVYRRVVGLCCVPLHAWCSMVLVVGMILLAVYHKNSTNKRNKISIVESLGTFLGFETVSWIWIIKKKKSLENVGDDGIFLYYCI